MQIGPHAGCFRPLTNIISVEQSITNNNQFPLIISEIRPIGNIIEFEYFVDRNNKHYICFKLILFFLMIQK